MYQTVIKRGNESSDLVNQYLKEIGRRPLLTSAEEIEYGRQVQRLMALEQLRQPDSKAWAKAAGLKVVELERLLEQGRRAKRKMIESNLRLVVSIAKKYQRRGLELLDLIQEGSIGLNRATEKYDPERGCKFSTYATCWIRQAISRGITDKGRLIRIPVHQCEKMGHYRKALAQLSKSLERTPTTQEWADAAGISIEKLLEIVQQFEEHKSLDRLVGREQDTPLLDLLVAPENLEEQVEQRINLDNLDALMQTLSPRSQYVIAQRWGLKDGQERSLADIGKELNLSRERVRQVEAKGVTHLKQLVSQVKEN